MDVLVDDGLLLLTVNAPAHLGEIGLLHRIARTASVVANGPACVLRADGDEFLAALSDAPISPTLTDSVVARLHATPPQRPSSSHGGSQDAPSDVSSA